jgi:hypothetical protein
MTLETATDIFIMGTFVTIAALTAWTFLVLVLTF